MPQVSASGDTRTATTANSLRLETATELKQLGNWLEDEICLALLEGDVVRAERLVLPQTKVRKYERWLIAEIVNAGC